MRIKKNGALLLLLLTFAILGGCFGEGDKKESSAPLRAVRSMIVSEGSNTYTRTFSGVLKASQEASLSFKVAGTVQKISVSVGDAVKKGQLLAAIEPESYTLKVRQSEAQLAEAKAVLENQSSNYQRTKELYESSNASKNELDNARAAYESAKASVRAAQSAYKLANLNLSYTKLIAEKPYNIASVDAEEGENIAPGTQVFYATFGKGFEVRVNVPENVISSIKRGMKANVILASTSNKLYKGTVTEVGVSNQQSSTTFPVTVKLADNDIKGLKSGLSANVGFLIERNTSMAASAIVVPLFAVGEDENGRFVYLVQPSDEDSTEVKRQQVTVGDIFPDGIEILEGIKTGDHLVIAGVSVLRDGMKVKNSHE